MRAMQVMTIIISIIDLKTATMSFIVMKRMMMRMIMSKMIMITEDEVDDDDDYAMIMDGG